MYSKNDYRYYLEHRLAESDDYLAHYGIKGMKWKKHSKITYDGKTGTWTKVRMLGDNKGRVLGVSTGRSTRTGETAVGVSYANAKKKSKKPKVKKLGKAVYIDTGDFKSLAIDTTTRRKKRKATAKRLANLVVDGKPY